MAPLTQLNLKPAHAPVKAYYDALAKFERGNFDNEGNIRGAFEDLLKKCARQFEWSVIPEYQLSRTGRHPLRADAALLDAFNLPRGYWEAKDAKDDLKAEMNKKFAAGYPRTNILFQSPTQAILVQNGHIEMDADISDPAKLVDVLRMFFEYRQPHQEDWDRAASDFYDRIPDIAKGAMALIESERKTNKVFVERFTAFANLCRDSINPDLKDESVEEMLVQHLLTERIFRRIFDNPEFTRRNIIAAEIEKVIDSLTKRHFSRDSFLRELDPFYKAIEEAAASTNSYTEKQAFINKVYEKFFQGFNKKQADTHGIVYTPQSIVDFMVRSVEEVLKTEFGRSLSDKGVHILDPFVGTGNFITRIMQEIRTSSLPQKYREELHCNEIMLLPYYIASMNIEHAYLEWVKEYEPFEGICLVDTFELAEPKQAGFEFMTEGNTERIRRQKKAPIFVVIGNPPYNMGQADENDQNKNRKYKNLDKRVRDTYVRASKATLRNKLSDPYVKAFRFATDRIGSTGGIIAFVSNNSFLDKVAFDGMRSYLAREFTKVIHLNLKGDAHTSDERRRREGGNIFENQIRVGIGITILVMKPGEQESQVLIHSVDDYMTSGEKTATLLAFKSMGGVPLKRVLPDRENNWLTAGQRAEFAGFLRLGDRRTKGEANAETIFRSFSLGIATNRDLYNYSFDLTTLESRLDKASLAYNDALDVYRRHPHPRPSPDEFVDVEDSRLKWTRQTKASLARLEAAVVDRSQFRCALYRAYGKQHIYFGDFWNEERYQQHRIFPTADSNNACFCVNDIGFRSPLAVLATDCIPDLHVLAGSDGFQCFPFYTYEEDGTNRRENITDWSLAQFRTHYGQQSITKWDIFHYTYALLHHPEYRTRYAANLKRELPRIPYAPDFEKYVKIGAALMKLHIEYEQQPEYPLEKIETGKLNWRVERMTLSKDKTQLRYNDFLTLGGIPPEAYDYRLGNRSALEWVVDQYQVSTDKRSGIVNDPNRTDDPEYIVRLIGQVVQVSLETVKLVRELEALPLQKV